jgi:hypothetical protein
MGSVSLSVIMKVVMAFSLTLKKLKRRLFSGGINTNPSPILIWQYKQIRWNKIDTFVGKIIVICSGRLVPHSIIINGIEGEPLVPSETSYVTLAPQDDQVKTHKRMQFN